MDVRPTGMDATSPRVTSAPPHGVTETQHALAHMTPQTRALVTPKMLDARIGQHTFAGALNDQVRFRVDRTGAATAADWKLVPDSPSALAVVQSKAGPKLLKQLHTGLREATGFESKTKLDYIVLPKDIEGVEATYPLQWLKDPHWGGVLGRAAEHSSKRFGAKIRDWTSHVKADTVGNGAWHLNGWITYMPDTARGVLAAADAYEPAKRSEADIRTSSFARYLARVHPHEATHAVTPATEKAYAGTATWIEEGTADVLANTPVYLRRNQAAAGLDARSYRNALRRESVVDLGWKPYAVPTMSATAAAEFEAETARTYTSGEDTVRGLARLAGVDFRTTAGHTKVRELLQSKSMRYTPGLLAKGIIEHQGLDPKVYEKLRMRIKEAVDLPGGVPQLAREFGIA